MALLSAEHLAGPGYIILNVMRAVNIITLTSVVVSSVVMLVKTFIVSKFFFFDATSHVITALVGLFLVVSECSLFRGYFARNWPLLSPSHGFVALGSSMMVLGLNMLGNMNKQATSQESLSLPFWRLLVASGILAVVIGFFNIISSFIFRDKSRHITARRVRSHGAITLTEDHSTYPVYPSDPEADPKLKAFTITTHHTGSSLTSRTATSPPVRIGTPTIDMHSPAQSFTSPKPQDAGKATNRFSQFDFNPLRAFRTRETPTLPSYHSTTSPAAGGLSAKSNHHRRTSSLYSRSTSGQTKRSFWLKRNVEREFEDQHVPEISAPLNVNPQFAHLVRPDLAHHPSVRRPDEGGLGLGKF